MGLDQVSLDQISLFILRPLLELAVSAISWAGSAIPPLSPLTDWAVALLQHPDIVRFLVLFVEAALFLAYATLTVLALTWLERKLLARLQDRRGPMHVGKFGLLQPIADMFKFLGKEDTVPRSADRLLFTLAVVALPAIAFTALGVVPMAEGWVPVRSDVALLLVFAIFSLGPLWVFVGGWAANNKYTLLGGMRGAAQMIAYEIPLVLSTVGIVILVGSFNVVDIVKAQGSVWLAFLQPLGFFVFAVGMIAEVERLPFDIPEAEAELVAGWNTEYSGLKFTMAFFAEFIRLYIGSALLVLLFLGGWNGPALPFLPASFSSLLWFLLKVWIVMAFVMWATRASFPRLRMDQLLNIGWKRFLPLAMVNILMAMAVVSLGWRP